MPDIVLNISLILSYLIIITIPCSRITCVHFTEFKCRNWGSREIKLLKVTLLENSTDRSEREDEKHQKIINRQCL